MNSSKIQKGGIVRLFASIKRKLAVIMVFVIMVSNTFVSTAQALGDITITNDPGEYAAETNGTVSVYAQSFTATKTGILKSISVSGWMVDATTLKIYEGGGTTGTLLHSQVVPIQNNEMAMEGDRYIFIDIPLSSPINITSGQKYTFEFPVATTISMAYGFNTYANGNLYYNGGTQNAYDLVFKVVQGDPSDTTSPVLSAGIVDRTSDTAGTVKFTSDEAGQYYYEVVEDGALEPTIITSGAGTDCTTSETTITNPTGLTAGAKDIYIKVKDAAGNVSNAIKIDIAAYIAPPITYTLTYTAGTNGSITGTTPQNVNQGADGTTVTAVPDAGYHFVNWSDGVTTASRTDSNVSGNINVTANFEVNVSNSTISQSTGNFDKKTSAQGDVVITMSLSGNTLSSIVNGATPLLLNTDYTVVGNTVTIKKEYLALQAVGVTNLIFNFSAGNTQTLVITVSDTTEVASGVLLSTNPTITFTNHNDFSGSTVTDGQGGSTAISDIDIQIISGDGYTWSYEDPYSYYDDDYGIGASYENSASSTLIKIKSLDSSNFNFRSFFVCDYGGSHIKVTGYRNNVSIGSVNLDATKNGYQNTFNQSNGLTASIFENVDEIRITPQDNINMWIVLNNIQVGTPIASAVEITAFDAIGDVAAGIAGSATYVNAAAVIEALPTSVKANNNAVTVPVTTWVNTDGYNPAVAGSYTFTATLGAIPAGYANTGNHKATVEVIVTTPLNSTISPSSVLFDKKTSAQTNVIITVALNGNNLSSITNGVAPLMPIMNYTVSGNTVMIRREYLAIQGVGITNLTFNFNAGNAQTLTVNIIDTTLSNSTINPSTGLFDKKTSAQADVTTTMTLNGNTLSSITNAGIPLVLNEDYTVSGDIVTIKKEYLAAQGVGTTSLTFNFSAGNTQTLTVTVSDTTPPNSTISPSSVLFDKKTSAQTNVIITMALNGNSLSGITNGAAPLMPLMNYIVSGNTVTIRKEYLATQGVGTTNLTFNFSAGNAQTLAVNIIDTTLSNSTINPSTGLFDKKTSAQADVTTTMTLNGNTLSSITNGVAPLMPLMNYIVSGNTVTIRKEYLATQGVGTTNLTFNFSAGNTQTLAVTVIDTTPLTYTLIYAAGLNGSITGTTSQTVNHGASGIEVTAVPAVGYHFVSWNDGKTTASRTDSNVSGNVTVTAYFAINLYTVSFNVDGGSAVTSQEINYNEKTVKPAEPTKTGYTFSGWYTDNTFASEFDFANTAIAEATTVYAKWTINKYIVSFNVDGGSAVTSQEINYDEKAVKPADPTKTGYTFSGWYTDNTFASEFDFANTLITANTTIYAKWTINKYTVSFNVDGGSAVTSQEINYNEKTVKPADPTKIGYTFSGWYTDNTFASEFDFANTLITANTTIYAKWTINKYIVSFNVDGGSAVTSQEINYDEKAVKPADPTKTGYTFSGWYTDNTFASEFDFANIAITEVTTVYAKWTINQYVTTFNVDGGSAVDSQTVNYNTKATKPSVDPTKIGYTFKGWYADSNCTVAFDFTTKLITEATTIYAKWVSSACDITTWTIPVTPTVSGLDITKSVANGTTSITVTATASSNATWKLYSDAACTTEIANKTMNLSVGANTAYVRVIAQDGTTSKVYTLTITRAARYNDEDYTPSIPSTPTTPTTPSVKTEVVTVDVTNGDDSNAISRTVIERTTESNGSITDNVQYKKESAQQTVEQLKKSGGDTARIVIPDKEDKVSEVKVTIPKVTIDLIAQSNINLQIDTENARISLPSKSIQNLEENLFFRVVPIKEEKKQQEIKERAKQEEVVKEVAGNSNISVIGRPMTIETNMSKREVDIILPLKDIAIPQNPQEREAFLNRLGVFIEHSDGEKVLARAELVEFKDGVLGLKFRINKFSTFTIIEFPENLPSFDGETQVIEQKINLNQGFTIEFSNDADQGTVTESSIYITDSKGKIHKTELTTIGNAVKVKLMENYKFNETYYLCITKTIKSRTGKVLIKSVRYKFNTVNY